MKNCLRIVVLALALPVRVAWPAEFASFNTFGPNDTVQATGARQISDLASPSLNAVAVRFQAGVGGPLEQIHVALTRSGTTPTTTKRTFTVRTDNGNLPGAIIDSFVLSPPTTYTIYRPRSTTKPVLTAGAQYWLVGEINPTGTAKDNWSLNNANAFGRIAQQNAVDAPWTTFDNQQLTAFRITVSDIKYGSISGLVQADTDGDNLPNLPLAGVTLTLKDSLGNDVDGDPNISGVQPSRQLTSENGTYTFPNVAPGTYRVVESNPSGYGSISDSDGGNPDVIAAVVVPDNGAVGGNNFLDQRLAAVSGTALQDTDYDGHGDLPLAGVTVAAYADADEDGQADDGAGGADPVPVATAVTGTQGTYTLPNLPPRSYVIVESNPLSYRSVADIDATTDASGSPPDAPNTKVADSVIPVRLIGGETDSGNNFVDQKYGWIRGIVIADTTNDGVPDTRVPDVPIALKTAAGADVDSDLETPGVQPTTTLTDGVGHYILDHLPPGHYMVIETQVLGFLSLGDKDGGDPDVIGDQPSKPLVVVAGEGNIGNDFYENTRKPPTAATLGQFRAVTSGAPGVTVTWSTTFEAQVLGFHVERRNAAGAWERVTRQLVPAVGSSLPGRTYEVIDPNGASPGTRYRLLEINLRGEPRVMGEAAARFDLAILLTCEPAGLRIGLTGQPDSQATVEIAERLDFTGAVGLEVDLDAAGHGATLLPAPAAARMRFIRAVQR